MIAYLLFTFLILGPLKAETSGLKSRKTNQTLNLKHKEFQDQETAFSGQHCKPAHLVNLSHVYCGENFHHKIMNISTEDWCVLENIIRPYNDLTVCLETASHLVNCYYPNPDIQDFFLYIHSKYFHNCTKKEFLLEDAPHGLVITLTLIPVSLIPMLVYLVIWKSKIQE
ncbi:receptor activity-modifying protein 3 isoform X2 [Mastacembelus armatus]|uniref:receptor activity-modifying protein 3 isoform X2 n=1 Tax=Mastacembelus armatus TaxID=205130 RepID=UPI000E455328|nr:receptor activity-modifying protein 3-like isoform X2 [Mastacembelus armatus]